MASVKLDKNSNGSKVTASVRGENSEVAIIRVEWTGTYCSVSPSSDRKDDDSADFSTYVSGIKKDAKVKCVAHCYRSDGSGVGSAEKSIDLD